MTKCNLTFKTSPNYSSLTTRRGNVLFANENLSHVHFVDTREYVRENRLFSKNVHQDVHAYDQGDKLLLIF